MRDIAPGTRKSPGTREPVHAGYLGYPGPNTRRVLLIAPIMPVDWIYDVLTLRGVHVSYDPRNKAYYIRSTIYYVGLSRVRKSAIREF